MNTAISAKSFTSRAKMRALGTVLGFSLLAIAAMFFVRDWHNSWPLVSFYALLLLNTYFSIRTFASITPENNLLQHFIDMTLGLCLFILPFQFNLPLNFTLWMTLLFVLAALKYILLIPIAGYSRLLFMKIRVDSLGVLLCLLALWGILLGYVYISTVLWAIIFFLANIHVLWIKPHYGLNLHQESFV